MALCPVQWVHMGRRYHCLIFKIVLLAILAISVTSRQWCRPSSMPITGAVLDPIVKAVPSLKFRLLMCTVVCHLHRSLLTMMPAHAKRVIPVAMVKPFCVRWQHFQIVAHMHVSIVQPVMTVSRALKWSNVRLDRFVQAAESLKIVQQER